MSMVQLTIAMRGRARLLHAKKMTAVLNSQTCKMLLILFVLVAGASRAQADAALLMEEPYGEFGFFNPTGHSAVYLNHVCAESPVKLRICHPDEYGVVISRYHRIGGFDWIAIPLVAYLYAVDRVGDIPVTADARLELRLRDEYRREHLLLIVPNVSEKQGDLPKGDWPQLIGASYDRKIYAFQIETTLQEDQHLIALLNQGRNVSHFNLFFHNCADFSRNLLNEYYPHAVRRNVFVDLGLTTPKQDVRSLTKYAKQHRDLDFSSFIIPQVSGTIPRSKPTDGVLESLIKSKKYVAPLALLSPEVVAGMVTVYVIDGRFHLPASGPEFTLPLHAKTNAVEPDLPGSVLSGTSESRNEPKPSRRRHSVRDHSVGIQAHRAMAGRLAPYDTGEPKKCSRQSKRDCFYGVAEGVEPFRLY
jgi:hypothetical protein